jgi:DNA polymerase III epsilon subunit family exonuclease
MTRATPAGRSLERGLVVAVLALFLVPTLVAGGVLFLVWRQGVLEEPRALAVTVAIGLVLMMAYLAAVTHGLGRAVVARIHELRLGAELMAGVHPGHRLAVASPADELGQLAAEVNRLADQLGEARMGRDWAVARAIHELAVERSTLAAVLAAIGEGVVVTTPEGRVTLANQAAHACLALTGEALLGHELPELVEGPGLAAAFERLRQAGEGSERLALRARSGAALRVVATPLLDEDGRATGIVVVLSGDGPPPGRARPARRFVGAGLLGGEGGGERAAALPPALYDLALLDGDRRGPPGADDARPLQALTYVVLDTETTGLRPDHGDRVVSLAAVRVRDGAVRRGETFDALVHPGRAIPPSSARFHGITDAMVAEAPPIDVVLPAFLRFAGEAVLVGHELGFDLAFLAREARRLALVPAWDTRPVLDTLELSAAVHGRLPGHDLDAIAARLGVPVIGRHSALGDALTTAEILVRLLDLLEARGIRTLAAAREAGRRARRRLAAGYGAPAPGRGGAQGILSSPP